MCGSKLQSSSPVSGSSASARLNGVTTCRTPSTMTGVDWNAVDASPSPPWLTSPVRWIQATSRCLTLSGVISRSSERWFPVNPSAVGHSWAGWFGGSERHPAYSGSGGSHTSHATRPAAKSTNATDGRNFFFTGFLADLLGWAVQQG